MQHTTAASTVQRKPEGIERTNLPREIKPSNIITTATPLVLNAEQAAVFEQVKRRSCVVMGPGGCGKSHMIRYMAQWAEREGVSMAVTSLTGAAALVLQVPGASTLHRWSGVGLGNLSLKETLDKIRFRSYLLKKWQETQILVIDEISMMSQKLFDLLDGVARAMRKTPSLPFGGLRVVCFGDFYQLAPVPDRFQGMQPPGVVAPVDTSGCFCFESPLWASMFPPSAHFQLSQMVRQSGDPEFQKVLSEIRVGECSDESAEYLAKRVMQPGVSAGGGSTPVVPIKLYPKNVMVDRENELAYAKVVGAEKVYVQVCAADLDMWRHNGEAFNSRDMALVRKSTTDTRKTELQNLQRDAPCADKLKLKVGTAVILLTNMDVEAGLANGSQGTVVRFEDANADAKKDLEGVVVCCPAIAKCAVVMLPVVKFANGVERIIGLHWWQSASMPCVGVGQIPLKHGWARSIHSSQGATYDTALLDIGGDVFATGQTYVAVSRVRAGDGLHLVRFDRTKIHADPKVTKFYKWLEEGGGEATELVFSKKRPADVAAALPEKKKWEPRSSSAPVVSIWGDDDDDDA